MPFERNWRILIWRLRHGYYSTDVASTGKLQFGGFQFGDQRSNRQIKTTAKFPRYTVINLHTLNMHIVQFIETVLL